MNTIAEAIVTAAVARMNCHRSGNIEWFDHHTDRLDALEKLLPSGAGIDNGTKIVKVGCAASIISLLVPYHNMNEDGYYDGWTTFEVVSRSTFLGLDIDVKPIHAERSTLSTADRDEATADYLSEVYGQSLSETD